MQDIVSLCVLGHSRVSFYVDGDNLCKDFVSFIENSSIDVPKEVDECRSLFLKLFTQIYCEWVNKRNSIFNQLTITHEVISIVNFKTRFHLKFVVYYISFFINSRFPKRGMTVTWCI